MRKTIAVVAGLVILVLANWTIYQRERLIESGAVVRLELAPVDPRSLMQGDYMALRFRVAEEAFGNGLDQSGQDGRIVVSADENGVARFVRRDGGEPLGTGERLLRYRVRDGTVKFGTNAWFFQEGTGSDFETARYGEFRVSPAGDMLLTRMLGRELQPLGRPPG